jgi:hypothetical protein
LTEGYEKRRRLPRKRRKSNLDINLRLRLGARFHLPWHWADVRSTPWITQAPTGL